MCGICGIFHYGREETVDLSTLSVMTDMMSHRGPDDRGVYPDQQEGRPTTYSRVGLGHRRLSIIDLTPSGHQPMSNEDETLWIVYNGEIYNYLELRKSLIQKGHIFHSSSDTEVILHLFEEHGERCPEYLSGMFSFVIWDSKAHKMFGTRDRLGIKPLYYYDSGTSFVFASEIKPIFQSGLISPQLDLQSLDYLLTYRYVPSPDTAFSKIKKVPPGHFFVCDQTGVHIHCYWPYVPQLIEGVDEAYLIERIRHLFQKSVKSHMVSDVPVGLLLSSGLDSSSVLSVMRQCSPYPIKTFTLGFEGGERTNELRDARATARMFGTDHYECTIGPADYQTFFEDYLFHLEEPILNLSGIAWFYVSKLAREHVKVVLTGQGADEPLAGYTRYLGERFSHFYRLVPSPVRFLLRSTVEATCRREALRRAVRSLEERDTLKRFHHIYAVFDASMKAQLYRREVAQCLAGTSVFAPHVETLQKRVEQRDALSQLMYIDTRVWLPDDLLTVGDKLSMAVSLEARVPFLDHEFIEFLEGIPSALKIKHLRAKYIWKKAVQDWLPPKVIDRPKKGFSNPVDDWLRNRMKNFAHDLVLDKTSACARYFDLNYIRSMLDAHSSYRRDFHRQIFLLVCFEVWHRRFIK
ncbi:MAG: asparagine synthase (glutamine-hydrolyzing) [Candidatus Handelsmanbacteria bacterium RIFCSPLOWO2_12_FULL_64_10]|uniref:asparagine synthase (glutamine-hydrolyzing) n=1 Tax=Handelsmanbacteria sp. (strain RIFCSPLOWO2_12_FULL_64_10) TaxID=1817868 RepID=A0A1F6CFZ2_HANXR|nr:MAG: asparagine synthase (glutamine-hydrolyzing) [Candidatus Handelsmanbacteria bacterium RIFCSPLOWO2_12_FULL_64_10]